MYHYNTMSSLFIRADSIITIYDQQNVTPVRNAIRRETNQPDLPTVGLSDKSNTLSVSVTDSVTQCKCNTNTTEQEI